MIIEPKSIGATAKGYGNRHNVSLAEFFIAQNQSYSDSPLAGKNRYVHIVSALDSPNNLTDRRMIMVSPDDSYILIRKEKTDQVYATNGTGVFGAGSNVLFTKVKVFQ